MSLRTVLLLFSIIILLTSCSSAMDKKAVNDKTELIMSALADGSFSDVPELENMLSGLDKDTSEAFLSSLKGIKSWSSDIAEINATNALVEVTAESADNTSAFALSFSKKDEEWVLDKSIIIKQTIDFIPFIGSED